ncbi:MAG: hypothetical protein KatS3mg090_0069 [Patescibacteria group bacterium]|nr:MAG: hypothetical protein KatS3mg090_0069 [Patescibacteria group bacterium]
MKKKDFVSFLVDFIKKTLNSMPNDADLEDEVKMMLFKIRLIEGDLSKLLKKDKKNFLRFVWLVGKLNDLFEQEANLSEDEKNNLIDAFVNIYNKKFLNTKTNLKGSLEIELLKRSPLKKFYN